MDGEVGMVIFDVSYYENLEGVKRYSSFVM